MSGLLAVVLGVLILVWPGKSLIVASVLFGINLLVSGVAQVIFAFSLHVSAGSRILLFVSGAASLSWQCSPSAISVRGTRFCC